MDFLIKAVTDATNYNNINNFCLEDRFSVIELEATLVIGVATEEFCSCACLTFRPINMDTNILTVSDKPTFRLTSHAREEVCYFYLGSLSFDLIFCIS